MADVSSVDSPLPTDGSATAPAAEREQALSALRTQGAQGYDPVRFHYLQALAKRVDAASLNQPASALSLQQRWQQRLQAYQCELVQARADAEGVLSRINQAELATEQDRKHAQQLFDDGDYKALVRLQQRLRRRQGSSALAMLRARLQQQQDNVVEHDDGSLTSLLRQQEQRLLQAHGQGQTPQRSPAQRQPLKALRQFQVVQTRRRLEQRINDAINQSPEDAGPLNSHRLVIRSLLNMRTISPDYLHRFTAYVDTLLWLERLNKKR